MVDKDQSDAASEAEGPVSTFQSLFAEGDGLWKQGEFLKAVEAFSKVCALVLCVGGYLIILMIYDCGFRLLL